MSKNTIPASVIDPAKVLGRYELALIRRKQILKAAIERLALLERKISEKLNPAIDAELKARKSEKKAVVAVGTVVVEVQRFDRLTPKYKDLLDQFADETMVEELLKEVTEEGDPRFLSQSTTWKARLVGRNATLANILKP